jgi:PilZ domain
MNRRSSQRKAPRRAVRVECRRGALGFGPNLTDAFMDISDGGIRLILKTPLPLQSEVEVILTGYGVAKPIKRIANVCWSVTLEDGRVCVGINFQKRIPFRDVQLLSTP